MTALKRFFSWLGKIVTTRWFLTLVGVILFCLLIWYIGPLVAIAGATPLGSEIVRLITIIVLFAVWGAWLYISHRRSKQLNEDMVRELGSGGSGDGLLAPNEEMEILGERFDEALATLRSSQVGKKRSYLYQLPWYVIIGPPGAGKTTALLNSGLHFPLSDDVSGRSFKGVGGTRHCKWWFTDEAVLIDTAGRYTTREDGAWLGFLDMLKKHRSRQPLNGVLVAISVTDLTSSSQEDRMFNARAVQKRIQELDDRLGIRLPVYLIITKMDLLSGFSEFFDDLDTTGRAQVWGITYPLETSESDDGALDGFDAEFGALLDRLNAKLFERIQHESDPELRARIFSFPQQIASIRGAISEFLEQAFRSSRYHSPPLLRGIYLSSGTQEGTPMDRLLGTLATDLGLDARAKLVGRSTGRSYFLTGLLRDVIFGESGLAGTDRSVERFQKLRYIGSIAAGVAVFLVASITWVSGYSRNSTLITELDQSTRELETELAAFPDEAIGDANPRAVIAPLNRLRAMPYSEYAPEDRRHAGFSLGLGQRRKARPQLGEIYRQTLNRLLLPRLVLRLEDQIRSNMDRPDILYEALRVYLTVGGQGPLDPDSILAWLTADWRAYYPGAANEDVRTTLLAHSQTLFSNPVEPPSLDAELIQQVRAVLLQANVSTRIFSLLRDSPQMQQLEEWRLIDHFGPAGDRLIARKSGQSLATGVPGMFTREGYFLAVVPAIRDLTEAIREEAWVLGEETSVLSGLTQIGQLRDDVTKLYMDAFVSEWSTLLSDIEFDLRPELRHSIEQLTLASGPASPIRFAARAITAATDLTTPEVPGSGVAEAGATAIARSSSRAARAARIVGSVDINSDNPEDFVVRRFAPLRDAVRASEGLPSDLDRAITIVGDLGRELNRVAVTAGAGVSDQEAIGQARAVATSLGQVAERMPEPISAWLQAFERNAFATLSKGNRDRINGAWQDQVVPVCRGALQGRFPVLAGARSEIGLDDFSRLFQPDGLVNQFFSEYLRQYVQTGQSPWRYNEAGQTLGIPGGTLRQFEKAQEISRSFFAGGGAQPQVRYQVEPVALDAVSQQVVLMIDGRTITYRHGPRRAVAFQWPNAEGPGTARIVFEPQLPSGPATRTWDGDWALFRMLKDENVEILRDQQQDEIVFRVKVGPRDATFRIRASSIINPFTAHGLDAFRCPPSM